MVTLVSVACPLCGQDTDQMTVAQVARLLGVSEVTVRKLCRSGRFDGATNIPLPVPGGGTKRVWRIPAADVVLLLRRRESAS